MTVSEDAGATGDGKHEEPSIPDVDEGSTASGSPAPGIDAGEGVEEAEPGSEHCGCVPEPAIPPEAVAGGRDPNGKPCATVTADRDATGTAGSSTASADPAAPDSSGAGEWAGHDPLHGEAAASTDPWEAVAAAYRAQLELTGAESGICHGDYFVIDPPPGRVRDGRRSDLSEPDGPDAYHFSLTPVDFLLARIASQAGSAVADAVEDRLVASRGDSRRVLIALAEKLPWHHPQARAGDIREAKRHLDETVVGQQRLKSELLGYVATLLARGGAALRPILIAGPPGTAKTSIARAVAEALGRPYIKIPLAGMASGYAIKGSESVFGDSGPGAILKAYAAAGEPDPVICLDEIDKAGESRHAGLLADALVDVLDPDAARQFRDTFFDVAYDVSRALYIATANETGDLPAPLLERCEIFKATGYSRADFYRIATECAGPGAIRAGGFRAGEVTFADSAYRHLAFIQPEGTGARGLVGNIERVLRSARLHLALGSRCVFIDVDFVRRALSGGATPFAQSPRDRHLALDAAANPAAAISPTRPFGQLPGEGDPATFSNN